MISLLEPIDRVNPAVNERQPGGRRRQGRRFPTIGDEEQDSPASRRDEDGSPRDGDESPHDDAELPAEAPARDPEDGEGRIDIRVAGRSLPTRQALPSRAPAPTLH